MVVLRHGRNNGVFEVASTTAEQFGPDDPRTLAAAECLAAAHLLLGRAGKAIRLGREVVAARRRVLGAAHPDTLAARLGVGLAYAQARAESQAIGILASALQDAEAATACTASPSRSAAALASVTP